MSIQTLKYKTLEDYKTLQDQGRIYDKLRNEGQYSAKELLFNYYKKLRENGEINILDIDQLHDLLNFKSAKTKEGDYIKTEKQANIQSKYLLYTKYLAAQYFKEKGTCSPRIKSSSTTEEKIIKGVQSMQNVYPISSLIHVERFLDKNPIVDWSKSPFEVEGIDLVEGKCLCKTCGIKMNRKSLLPHLRSKRHLAKLGK